MHYYLITGANRGIGLELTKQILSQGDGVLACCRNPERARELKNLVDHNNPNRLIVHQLDMTQETEINALPLFLAEHDISVAVLILNAGIAEPSEHLGNIFQQQMMSVLMTNTIGPMVLIQALATHLSKSKNYAKVICLSSDLGSLSLASGLAYGLSDGVSKAALNMGVKKLTADLKSLGISIHAIHPGWVQTDMGGKRATLTSTESCLAMLHVINGLKLEHSGSFLNHLGQKIPW